MLKSSTHSHPFYAFTKIKKPILPLADMQMFWDMTSTKAEASTTGLKDEYIVWTIIVVFLNAKDYNCLLLLLVVWSLLLAQVDVHEAADEQQGDTRPGQDVAIAKVA